MPDRPFCSAGTGKAVDQPGNPQAVRLVHIGFRSPPAQSDIAAEVIVKGTLAVGRRNLDPAKFLPDVRVFEDLAGALCLNKSGQQPQHGQGQHKSSHRFCSIPIE